MQVLNVPVDVIVAGKNDRRSFNQQKLEELAASIGKFGLAQPPTLRPYGNGRYQIVAGERRIRAIRDVLGWSEVRAQVVELDDEQASAIMLLENTGREDLNAIEEAEAYKARIDGFGWTLEETAEAAGVSKGHVQRRVRLLDLADDIQEHVKVNAFPPEYAIKVTHLDNNRQRFMMCRWRDNPTMGMTHWRDIIRKATDEQGQERQGNFFELVTSLTKQIEDAPPWKGKQAVTGIPAGVDVAPVPVKARDNMSLIFDRYISDLRAAGQDQGADAVGNLYNLFVSKGWVTVTSEVTAPARNPEIGAVNDELHIRKVES